MTTMDKRASIFLKRCDQKLNSLHNKLGNLLVHLFHQITLFAIRAVTVWASFHAFIGMVQAGQSSIGTIR